MVGLVAVSSLLCLSEAIDDDVEKGARQRSDEGSETAAGRELERAALLAAAEAAATEVRVDLSRVRVSMAVVVVVLPLSKD